MHGEIHSASYKTGCRAEDIGVSAYCVTLFGIYFLGSANRGLSATATAIKKGVSAQTRGTRPTASCPGSSKDHTRSDAGHSPTNEWAAKHFGRFTFQGGQCGRARPQNCHFRHRPADGSRRVAKRAKL